MLSVGLSMLIVMMLLLFEMAAYSWRYIVLKFGVKICFSSIHEHVVVLMKIKARFMLYVVWWLQWCNQLAFLGEIGKFDFGRDEALFTNPRSPDFLHLNVFCMLLLYHPPTSQWKYFIFWTKTVRFDKWRSYLQNCHSDPMSHWIKLSLLHFISFNHSNFQNS